MVIASSGTGVQEQGVHADKASPEVSGPILIIEDHPIVAQATGDLIRLKYPQLCVFLAESATAALAYPPTDWFRVFADLEIPGACGLSLVHELVARGYGSRLCIITAFAKPAFISAARELGVLGYILKTGAVDVMASSLDAVIRGNTVFPLEAGAASTPPVRLTARQLSILQMVQRGSANKQIASELGISEGTVHNHVSALLKALDANNRTQAVAKGIVLGLLSPDPTEHR